MVDTGFYLDGDIGSLEANTAHQLITHLLHGSKAMCNPSSGLRHVFVAVLLTCSQGLLFLPLTLHIITPTLFGYLLDHGIPAIGIDIPLRVYRLP